MYFADSLFGAPAYKGKSCLEMSNEELIGILVLLLSGLANNPEDEDFLHRKLIHYLNHIWDGESIYRVEGE